MTLLDEFYITLQKGGIVSIGYDNDTVFIDMSMAFGREACRMVYSR
ncbi:hypothetical protein XSR1_210005 [Xenorhabdus szentirmaii DSM 16338]|uniref:Uncharacterized protein n=1 Tax=Xenorhabdus szentirmaii DSM 16338 TaxID=1427518 RepID=W1IVP1_9GAMM|nr:hypothetical protein XSR1_210005 [Xenorhabdus szentirmaii DSM 16338]